MATSVQDLTEWYERGKQQGATHMIVVCDMYDWEDYPCFVSPNESVTKKAQAVNGSNMQKVMEVYNLAKPFNAQKTIGRFAFDGWSPNEKA